MWTHPFCDEVSGIATHAEVVPVQRVVNFGQEDLDVELSLCVAVYFFIMTLEYCITLS